MLVAQYYVRDNRSVDSLSLGLVRASGGIWKLTRMLAFILWRGYWWKKGWFYCCFSFFFWFLVMGSSWETEWEYLCWTNWMSSNYPETPDTVLSMARYEGKCDQTPEASQAEKSHRWKEVNCVRMRVAPRRVWKSLSQLSAQPRLFSIVVGSHKASSYAPHISSPSLAYGQAAELSLPNSLGTFGACCFCPVPLKCLSCRKWVLTHYLWTEPQAEMTLAASVWVLRGQWPFSSRTGLALVSVKQPWELSELREPSSVAFVEGLTQARPYVSAFYRESCLPKVTDSCTPHPTLL